VGPNHNVGPFPGLSRNRETGRDVLGRFDADPDPKVTFKLPGDFIQALTPGAIHPDQKLAIGPGDPMQGNETSRAQG
jgi:hypothetical protein